MKAEFKWIGGATWILRIGSIKIACDPVLCRKGHVQNYKYFKSTRLNDPVFDDDDFKNINLWLLTHNHEDHIDKEGKERIERNNLVIAHNGLRNNPLLANYPDIHFPDWHESVELTIGSVGLKVTTLPAIHGRNKLAGKAVGNGNGYFLKITNKDDKYFIYITGDSVFKKSHSKWFKEQKVDLIIANAGEAVVNAPLLSKTIGRITNNSDDIISMADVLKPKLLIPIHWGTFSHYMEILKTGLFTQYDNIKFTVPGEEIALST